MNRIFRIRLPIIALCIVHEQKHPWSFDLIEYANQNDSDVIDEISLYCRMNKRSKQKTKCLSDLGLCK